RTQVTDAGLKELAGLKNLQELDLGHTQVTGVGLKELNELKDLQWLDLSRTKLTDAGLMQLKGLKKLRSLYLRKTEVTDAGVTALKEALPGVHVSRKDPFDFMLPHLHYSPPDFGLRPIGKPGEPFHWENVPWPMLLALGVIVLVGAMAAGVYKARHPD
ncbi:MAG TPA: hypothetical protein VKD72_28260, partial [Gemmataceae bacterium]|nr:hypothetical protein [Gemmataceae bacterium]